MLSSAFFWLAAQWFFSLRGLKVLLEREPRIERKRKLLRTLNQLKSYSFVDLSVKAVQIVDVIFNELLTPHIGGARYIARAVAIGFLFGVFLSYLFGLPFSNSLSELLFLPSSFFWRQLVLLPSAISGAILFVVDITIAHLLCRWALRGHPSRALASLVAALFIAYCLLAIGTGIVTAVGLFIMGDFFWPSFIWNRIVAAFADPFSGVGNVSRYGHNVPFLWLGASGAVSTLGSVIVYFGVCLLRFFPSAIRTLLATPLFWVLDVMRFFEKRGVNIPIGLIALITTFVSVVIVALLKMQGF